MTARRAMGVRRAGLKASASDLQLLVPTVVSERQLNSRTLISSPRATASPHEAYFVSGFSTACWTWKVLKICFSRTTEVLSQGAGELSQPSPLTFGG